MVFPGPSVNLDYEEVGKLPELIGISNHDDLLTTLVHDIVGVLGLRGHDFGLIAVGRNLGERTAVGRSEVIFVEITLHHLGLAEET